jgi:ribosomal protein S18 acetylase RimI-like enzyme
MVRLNCSFTDTDPHMEFQYQLEPQLTPEAFVDLLRRSTLAERRPVDDRSTIDGMLKHADIIVTARTPEGMLVGVSRAISDFSYCTYLSDLAVDVAFQRRGIGRELVQQTHRSAGLNTTLILLSAPKAESYYPHIGMHHHASCWRIDRKRDLEE